MKQNKKASLTFIFITVLVDVIGLSIIIPVIPDLIIKLDGGNLSEASKIGGLLLFSFAIMQFFFAPVMGVLSDKFGRKPILLIALAGLGFDYILHAYAPNLAWLFAGRLIAGICGASFTVAASYIADISLPEEKAQNFGLIGAAFGLGFIIGPALGGVAGDVFLELPFYIAACLSFLNLLYGLIILPESLPKEKRKEISFSKANPIGSFYLIKKSSVVGYLAIAFFLLYIAGYAVQATWTFHGIYKFEWTKTMVGYSLGLVGVVVAIVQGMLVKHTVRWFGENKTIIIGYCSWIIGLLMFAFVNKSWLLFMAVIPYCLGGIATPTIQGIISNQYQDTEQGELQGAMTSLISLTAVIGPVIMTEIFGYFTSESAPFLFPGAPFAIGACCVAISFIITRKGLSIQQKSPSD